MEQDTTKDSTAEKSNITCPIFIAAKQTVAMTTILKKTPK
jgi:hypothetical protein